MKEITLKSFCIHGIEAVPVNVTVSNGPGIGLHMYGIPDIAVKECLLRTCTALQALGYKVPGTKLTISISDASGKPIQNGTPAFDLPVAIGIILASGQLNAPDYDKYAIAGELGLDGSVRKVRGEYIMALAAEKIIISSMDAMRLHDRPGIAGSDKVFLADNLDDALTILQGGVSQFSLDDRTVDDNHRETSNTHSDLGRIVGNEIAKRGLLIAAAGGHHIACLGPVGKKTQYLADCLRQILPPLAEQQYIETQKIYDAAGVDNGDCSSVRPLRIPYCSSSIAKILGHGSMPLYPGDASLAHNGVLLLKEFEEFPKPIREALSHVLQEKEIIISRLRDRVVFPADFQLMLSSLPCPCGYHNDGTQRCTCTPTQIKRYRQQFNSPVYDKCDIHIWVQPLKFGPYTEHLSNADCKNQVKAARDIQALRFSPDCGIRCNAEIPTRHLKDYCPLSPECEETLSKLFDSLSLPAGQYSRIVRVARTIADLAGSKDILKEHIAEAVSYRFAERH